MTQQLVIVERRNMTIKQFTERVSVRNFDQKPVSEEDLKIVTEVINNAPTSTNTQQFSAIIITDQEIKEWIAKKNFNQRHIADSAGFIVFVGDRTRVRHIIKDQKLSKKVLAFEFHRAVVDASIAATYAHDALIELGYGTTFVGGIMGFADELEKKLKLPPTTYITVGLSFGKATKRNGFKPKMNKVFVNEYNKDETNKEVEKYEKEQLDYFLTIPNGLGYYDETKKTYDVKGMGKVLEITGEYIIKKWNDFE